MHRLKPHVIAILTTTLLTTSCVPAEPVDVEKMNTLADALTKVSAPVHATVRYKNPPTDAHDKALLDLALHDFPERLDIFRKNVVKARQSGKNSSVLVCDSAGQTALIEDAGCTGTMDGRLWESHPGHSCDYVLDLNAVCSSR